MDLSHEQVIKTLLDDGAITRQCAKSIRGQIKNMQWNEAEQYLKKLIYRKGNRDARQAKQVNRRAES